MAFVGGVLVLVVGLLASVGLHELGHMIPAKRFGVRVSQYMIGFGQTLWSRTVGETEYGVKLWPLGGYVRIIGMHAPAEAVGAKEPRGWYSRISAQAREASAEEILPGEDHRAFYRLSTPRKLLVMAGGTFTNLGIAIVLLAVVLLGFGTDKVSTTVSTVSQCIISADEPDRACTDTDPLAPAAAAGVKPGDTIVSFGGEAITSWDQLVDLIRDSGGVATPMVVERDGAELTLTVTPIVTDRPTYDENDVEIVGTDGEPVTVKAGFLGVSPGYERVRSSVSELPGAVWDMVSTTVVTLAKLPVTLADTVSTTFSDKQRDQQSVVSIVGVGRLAGEIASSDGGGDGVAFGDRVAAMLSLLASLNVALFAFNLLPLPPMDGGHVAGALWEGGRRQLARWRGREVPGPSDTALMTPLAYVGVLALLAMGVILIVADIVKPITL